MRTGTCKEVAPSTLPKPLTSGSFGCPAPDQSDKTQSDIAHTCQGPT
jgi:hypothetical protein